MSTFCPLCEEELGADEVAELAADAAPSFTAEEALAIVERINDGEWSEFAEAIRALLEQRA